MGERLTKTATNGLVALSSAAIMAVYGAGYARTRAAADRFTAHATERRPHVPIARQRTTPATAAATPNRDLNSPPLAPSALAIETPASEAKAKPAAAERIESPRATNVASHTTQPRQAIHATEATQATAPTPATQATEATEAIQATQAIQGPQATQAPQATQSTQATQATQATKYRDGTYLGWGTSPHGDIQAAVIVEGGRITTAKVAQCLTRYSCAWIAPIPPVIIEQQGTTYDYVSGATESSDAFQNAVADALSHAL